VQLGDVLMTVAVNMIVKLHGGTATFAMKKLTSCNALMEFCDVRNGQPRAGSGVERINPFRFLVYVEKAKLNGSVQVLLSESVVLLTSVTF